MLLCGVRSSTQVGVYVSVRYGLCVTCFFVGDCCTFAFHRCMATPSHRRSGSSLSTLIALRGHTHDPFTQVEHDPDVYSLIHSCIHPC